ncbi:uncharacterized protein J4E88_008391 [Alternaria novae-zelandiae]|uniref:uncharacterized protein n=1 Tax=Alternaria novae-zelandiae TaxID=430562 RepID=UPI0020C2DD95|nr:uncharacterized protein J4E88_008391 [Alternaria novae-zelandiae]KAI4673924.1 hypothetical protein J4E88_008391 [Alternaria novae-zelandiae]
MVKLAGGWIDLNERYGEMFKGDFNPNICNKNTLKVLGLTHHCKDCKAPPSKKCFWQLHFAFCDECGERFTVWSKGCGKHPYSHGYNIIFKAVRDDWPASEIERLLAPSGTVPVEDFADILDNGASSPSPDPEDGDVAELAGMVANADINTNGETDENATSPPTTPLPEADPNGQVQEGVASPPHVPTEKTSRTSQWLPTGLKGKDAKGMRQARAATGRKIRRDTEAAMQAEIAADERVKEAQRAKRAADVAKRAEQEKTRMGRTGHKRK